MPEPAARASIIAPLPLAGDQPRFAPADLKTWGCDGAELRRDQVAPLSGPARQALRQALHEAGLKTAFVTSTDKGGEGWSLETLREALVLAAFFGAECVVTGAPPRGSSSGTGEHEAVAWLASAASLAEAQAIPLLVENRPGTWADTGSDFNQFMGQTVSPWLGVAFDPAGFVALREHPFLTAFMPGHLKSRLHLLRVRDARFEDGGPVPINHGNGEIAELVSAAVARSFGGFFAVGTPDSDPDEIRRALAEFKQLLAALGLERLAVPGGALDSTRRDDTHI